MTEETPKKSFSNPAEMRRFQKLGELLPVDLAERLKVSPYQITNHEEGINIMFHISGHEPDVLREVATSFNDHLKNYHDVEGISAEVANEEGQIFLKISSPANQLGELASAIDDWDPPFEINLNQAAKGGAKFIKHDGNAPETLSRSKGFERLGAGNFRSIV